MKLRPLVLVVGAALSVTLVAGCGGNSSGGASSSAPVAAAPSKAASMVAGEAVAAIKKATSGRIAVTQTGSASSSSGASVPTTTSVEGQFDDSNYQLANSYAGGATNPNAVAAAVGLDSALTSAIGRIRTDAAGGAGYGG